MTSSSKKDTDLFIISWEQLKRHAMLNVRYGVVDYPETMRKYDEQIKSLENELRPYNEELVWMTPEEEEKRIRQAAINGVLDDLIKWLNDCEGGDIAFLPNGLWSAPQPFNVAGLLKKIRELRQQSTASSEQQRGRAE